MSRVAIVAVPHETGGPSYLAVAGDKKSSGRTPGEALDLLTPQLPGDAGTLVVIQSTSPDRFFDSGQQQRLADLMGRWRVARDRGVGLPAEEQAELDALVEAEVQAAADRTASLLRELGQ